MVSFNMNGLRAKTGRGAGGMARPEESRGQHGHSQTQLFPDSLKPKNLSKIPMRAIKLKVP